MIPWYSLYINRTDHQVCRRGSDCRFDGWWFEGLTSIGSWATDGALCWCGRSVSTGHERDPMFETMVVGLNGISPNKFHVGFEADKTPPPKKKAGTWNGWFLCKFGTFFSRVPFSGWYQVVILPLKKNALTVLEGDMNPCEGEMDSHDLRVVPLKDILNHFLGFVFFLGFLPEKGTMGWKSPSNQIKSHQYLREKIFVELFPIRIERFSASPRRYLGNL